LFDAKQLSFVACTKLQPPAPITQTVKEEAIMTQNVGTIDRTIRIIVGLALIGFGLALYLPGTGWNWLGWVGVVPLLTGLFGTCPVYTMLGMSTCPVKRQ
jgi:hypothetical protein